MNNKNNVDRFSGFVDCYDRYRPVPPDIITKILMNYTGQKPSLVVDLGCGTGLSTFIWKGISQRIVGIDPNLDMLGKAMDKMKNDEDSKNIQFKFGYGNATGLEAECADIITCSSSFQWMEPVSTIEEVLRILKTGGVFAMYNHGQASGFDWIAEKAYTDLFDRIYKFMDDNREKEVADKLWTNSEYMSVMKKSGEFRFIKEIQVHNTVRMNADGIIGFALSQGALQAVKKMKVSWLDDEISRFIETVKGSIGNNEVDAVYSYSLRVAIR